MEPLGFLVLFLALGTWGMRGRWRQRRTRESSPSPLLALLLTSLFSSSMRTRCERRCTTSFRCLTCLLRFATFWTRISLDNSLLFFWAMRAILHIFLMASFTLYILKINFYSIRASKRERGARGSGLHFYIALTMGKYKIWSKLRFYKVKLSRVTRNWNKNKELNK